MSWIVTMGLVTLRCNGCETSLELDLSKAAIGNELAMHRLWRQASRENWKRFGSEHYCADHDI
jgi:hypothetical protein